MVFFLPATPFALELYSIIHQGCKTSTGLIINVDQSTVYQLNVNGKLYRLPRKGIEQILVYNTLDNPFPILELQGELGEFTRDVQVQTGDENSFTGWPIRFLENLIVFFDIKGKIHLVDIESIHKFTIPEVPLQSLVNINQFKQYHFSLGNNLPECTKNIEDPGQVVHPTRMISDKIKISKFLSVYHKGFRKLNRFRKRTPFYSRPYVFEKKTKIAIVVTKEDFQEELPQKLPLYFQWPSGSNYGPQGLLNIGVCVNEMLPNVEPVFGLRLEGKYHFLSVFFAGNPLAFSFGDDLMVENRYFFKDFFSKWDPDEVVVLPQYNQIALTGFEWDAYSISGGYYYPLIGIQGDLIFRELLSPNPMPIGSIQYTTPTTKYRLLISFINLKSNEPSVKNIKLIYADEMVQAGTASQSSAALYDKMSSFELRGQFLRFNLDLDISDDIHFGLSQVIFSGDYEETVSGSLYQLSYDQFITAARIQQEFGSFVSLKGFLNYFIREYHSKSTQHDKRTGEKKISLVVAIEFII